MWIALVVVIVIIAAAALYRSNKNKTKNETATNTNGSTTGSGTTPATTTPEGVDATPPATPGSAANLSYNQALAIYGKNGYRFQFDQCHGIPGSLSIKKGAKFMIDNRENKAHTIVIKSQTFKLPVYGFAIVTAKDLGTYNITCDGGGAASLNVEQ